MRGSQPKFLFKAFTVRSALRLRLSPLTHVWTRKKPEQTERTASRAMLRSCAGHGARTVASPRTATPPHRGRRLHLLRPRSSAKKSPQEAERGGGSANDGLAGALPSKTVLLRAGAVLFALGFVDAGYSGDWSRIGAISKDTEELLKLGAYAVVPLCLALALRVPGDGGGES